MTSSTVQTKKKSISTPSKNKTSAKIKAVIFDMDGVLIDAKEWHYEALNNALSLFGFSINRYDHLTTYDGLPTKAKLDLLTKDQGLPTSLHQFINNLKQKFTLQIANNKCKPVFQHEHALSKLKSENYKLVVASNSIRQSVEVMMAQSKLLSYLDFFISNEDVVKSKPDPEMYNTAIKKLELDPEECMVVEDNAHGIKAAQAAGAKLMVVNSIFDVTYDRIKKSIQEAEK